MARAVKHGFIVIFAAALCAACGGASGAPGSVVRDDGPVPPGDGSCTGPVPPNATMCPGTDTGLASDAPRVVTGSFCAGSIPCSYVCNAGFVGSGGACVAAPRTPATQFTDNGDGTVTVAGGLTWLRDANCADAVVVGGRTVVGGTLSWDDAVVWSGGLATGTCGLRDGSVPGDWRLPTRAELMQLAVDLAYDSPFLSVQSDNYWSSWTYFVDKAGAIRVPAGEYFDYPKTSQFYVWPVR